MSPSPTLSLTRGATSFIGWAGDAVFTGLIETPESTSNHSNTCQSFNEWSTHAVFFRLSPIWKQDNGDNGDSGDSGDTCRRKEKILLQPSTKRVNSGHAQCRGVDDDEIPPRPITNPESTEIQGPYSYDNNPSTEKALSLDGLCRGGNKSGSNAKMKLCNEKLMHAASESTVSTTTDSDQNDEQEVHLNLIGQDVIATDGSRDQNNKTALCKHKMLHTVQSAAMGEERGESESTKLDLIVPDGNIDRSKMTSFCKEKLLQAAQSAGRECDHDNNEEHGGTLLGNIDQSKTTAFCKEKLLRAAQSAGRECDHNYEKHRGALFEEDSVTPKKEWDQRNMTASDIVTAGQQAIPKNQCLPHYDNWAAKIVFSGLLPEGNETQQQKIKKSFNDWAGGVVFNDLVQQKKNLTSKHVGTVDDVTLETPLLKINMGDARKSDSKQALEHLQKDVPRVFADAEPKQKRSLKQIEKSSLKSSLRLGSRKIATCSALSKEPILGRNLMSCKPERNAEISFDDWAVGVVFSGLIPKPESKGTATSFKDWAAGIVFSGISNKSEPNAESQTFGNQSEKSMKNPCGKRLRISSEKSNNLALIGNESDGDGLYTSSKQEMPMKLSQIMRGGSLGASIPSEKSINLSQNMRRGSLSMQSEKSMNLSQILRRGSLNNSMQSEKSMNLSQVIHRGSLEVSCEKSMNFSGLDMSMRSEKSSEKSVSFSQETQPLGSKHVTFRGHDSMIPNDPVSTKSFSRIAEASMDFNTLVEDEPTESEVPKSSSETGTACKMNLMDISVGDIDFDHGESNSSLLPRSATMAGSKPVNFNMNLMEKSVGNFDFEYGQSNSSLPSQSTTMADSKSSNLSHSLDSATAGSKAANSNIHLMGKSSAMGDSKAAKFIGNLMENSVGHIDVSFTESDSSHLKQSYEGSNQEMSKFKMDLMSKSVGDFNWSRGEDSHTLLQTFATGDSKHLVDEVEPQVLRMSKPERKYSNQQQVTPSDRIKQPIQHQDNSSAYTNNISINGHDVPGYGQNPPNRNESLQYAIPAMATASVMKERAEDRMGMVFTEKRHKIILTNMTPKCPFRETTLAINDELLMINGHRVKSAKKAAELIKMSCGKLTLTVFKGKRPKESELEMMKLSEPDFGDIQFSTENGMVHINRAGGRFSKSGRIKAGDICLTINGRPVKDAEMASNLIREAVVLGPVTPQMMKSEHDDFNSGPIPCGLVIMLVFSLSKARARLITKISSNLPLIWNAQYNECAIGLPSGTVQRILRVHNDGYCENILEPSDEIDYFLMSDIDAFASKFYSHFQYSLRQLYESMQM